MALAVATPLAKHEAYRKQIEVFLPSFDGAGKALCGDQRRSMMVASAGTGRCRSMGGPLTQHFHE